jgi:hypothetical protein
MLKANKRKPRVAKRTPEKTAETLRHELRLAKAAHEHEVRRRTQLEAKLQTVGEILAPYVQVYLPGGHDY